MKRPTRNQIIITGLLAFAFLWFFNPLKWWLPRHDGKRSSGTTHGAEIIPHSEQGHTEQGRTAGGTYVVSNVDQVYLLLLLIDMGVPASTIMDLPWVDHEFEPVLPPFRTYFLHTMYYECTPEGSEFTGGFQPFASVELLNSIPSCCPGDYGDTITGIDACGNTIGIPRPPTVPNVWVPGSTILGPTNDPCDQIGVNESSVCNCYPCAEPVVP